MNRTTTFNFRNVMDRLGWEKTNRRNWAVGHALRMWASDRGIEPDRALTAKTNPNPSVAAPHCICAYPLDMIDDAIAYVENKIEGVDPDQLDFGF